MRELLSMVYCVVLSCTAANAQEAAPEKVNWNYPNMFVCKKLNLNTQNVKLSCNSCRCMEIKTASGVTGIFILGNGSFTIHGKKIRDRFTACLVRINPQDYKRLIVTTPHKKFRDAAYYAQSRDIIANMFRHSYHSDMDALLPPRNSYSVDLYTPKYGDIFASYAEDAYVVYDYTNRRKL